MRLGTIDTLTDSPYKFIMVQNIANLNPAARMFLGTAIGDAFGMGYEFRDTREQIAKQLVLDRYIPHVLGVHKAGDFTDDTHMSLGVAETLLAGHSTAEALADQFVANYQRDPIPGYSNRIATALTQATDGKNFIKLITNNSIGNGAAMRSLPYGVLKDPDDAVRQAILGARLTHDTPIGRFSAAAIALAAYYYYHHVNTATVFDFALPRLQTLDPIAAKHLERVRGLQQPDSDVLFGPPYEIGGKTLDGVPCEGLYTASAVYYLISNFNGNLFELLQNAIHLGGDTDSVASLALGLAAMDNDFSSLPEFILQDLTNAQDPSSYLHYNYVIQTGEKLGKAFPR